MKKNSWHYRLAEMGNQNAGIYSGDTSICEYSRKVVFGAIIFIAIVALIIAAGSFVMMALYEIVGAIFGFAEFGPAAAVLSSFLGLIISAYIFTLVKDKWNGTKRSFISEDNESFSAKAYRSYKEKICFPVTFSDE